MPAFYTIKTETKWNGIHNAERLQKLT
jgi:hypothetical protein